MNVLLDFSNQERIIALSFENFKLLMKFHLCFQHLVLRQIQIRTISYTLNTKSTLDGGLVTTAEGFMLYS